MKDNFVTLVLQAFQHEQYEIGGTIFETKKLVLKTDLKDLKMSVVQLKRNMRNSVKISELLEIAKEVINNEETRYYYTTTEMSSTGAASNPESQEIKDGATSADVSIKESDGDNTNDQSDEKSKNDEIIIQGFSKKEEVAKELINNEETRYYYSKTQMSGAASDSKSQEIKDGTTGTDVSIKQYDSDKTSDGSDRIDGQEFSKKHKNLPAPVRSQEHALKQMSGFGNKRTTEGLLIKYRFDQSTEVGHSHQGKIPELTFVPSHREILPHWSSAKCSDKQKSILKISACLQSVKAGDTIISHDEQELILIRHALKVAEKDFVSYAHCLENKNEIPSKDEKREVSEAIDEKKRIVLTDSNGCRGFQLRKAVIPLSSTEQFHRHTILENAARATSDILFIVIDCSALSWWGSKKSTFGKVIERWVSNEKIKITKTNISPSIMARFLNRLPSAEMMLHPTEARIHTGKPTFDDLVQLILDNKVSSIRYLLSSNPSIVKMRGDYGLYDERTLLMLASGYNRPSIVQVLLDHGADVEDTDNYGQTALHECANHNSIECLNLLLPLSSSRVINYQDYFNSTPLHLASRHGNIKCVEALLLHGADRHLKDRVGLTAYDDACSWRGDDETKRRIKEVLLQH